MLAPDEMESLAVPFAVIDHWTAPEFFEWVVSNRCRHPGPLVLDFAAVELLMAAGVQALVDLEATLAPVELRIVGPSRIVRRVLDICGLADRWLSAS